MWWTETRPAESGRSALVCDGVDLWGEVSVRTRVHTYGGGAWWPDGDDGVFACNDLDGRLWHVSAEGYPRPVAAQPQFSHGLRYADGRCVQGAVVCVRENHHVDGEEVNQVVRFAVDPAGVSGFGNPEVVAEGADFYASPRLSFDGKHLAWVQWNHPNMPWDQTELWLDGQCVIADQGSVVEPQWDAQGNLYVVSDRNGWWNLYYLVAGELEPVLQIEAELHRPAWVFDDPSYAVCEDNTVVAVAMRGSVGELWCIPPLSHDSKPVNPATISISQAEPLDLPWTSYTSLRSAGPHTVCAIVASPTQEPTAMRINVADGSYEPLRPPSHVRVDPDYISEPRPISFPTTNNAVAHGLYYEPTNPTAAAPRGELPPLLVLSHGGPTAAARSGMQLGIQYWTSRGIAVVDVNYRGSTGYGTAYRKALLGQWGVSDVDDCVAAALYLVRNKEVDGERLIISGSSAGGYTTLCALVFHEVFAAGASRYGIADLAALASDTHKFEAHYTDQLVGPYPQAVETYKARSPIHFVDELEVPMLVLQGSEDPVVPPSQAEMIVGALQERSIPVAYLLFEGEQHGFRQAANIVRALEAELAFFAEILGFKPADAIKPPQIHR
ncbi:MAG: S9 family peptidase [Acidimicrobiia bacterium]|nr:S9 family peptidase [Acidimicrobiia bacterium]MYC58412.1 S9 family peptidase [Acidimicrobiia bacterium]MYG94171.1 S9 family peptidase [Acidimicrobiia bacterium]MYI30482.1 S9 family peptidase [Acidimicrobiia bacterium]